LQIAAALNARLETQLAAWKWTADRVKASDGALEKGIPGAGTPPATSSTNEKKQKKHRKCRKDMVELGGETEVGCGSHAAELEELGAGVRLFRRVAPGTPAVLRLAAAAPAGEGTPLEHAMLGV
jgi:hypothetical protein